MMRKFLEGMPLNFLLRPRILETLKEFRNLEMARLAAANMGSNNLDSTGLLSYGERKALADGHNLEQLFFMLKALHQTVGDSPVIRRVINQRKDLADPNLFPVERGSNSKTYRSVWADPQKELQAGERLGFRLQVSQSKLQHVEAGDGLFYQSSRPCTPGTLLALFPGVIYSAKAAKQMLKTTANSVLTDQEVVCAPQQRIPYPFSYGQSLEEFREFKEKYKETDCHEVEGIELNPYAKGQFINHGDSQPNCTVFFLTLPQGFFFESLRRFIPVVSSEAKEALHLAIVVARRQVEPGEQLLCNYFEQHWSNAWAGSDWLVPPQSGEQAHSVEGMILQHLIEQSRRALKRHSDGQIGG